MSFIKKFWIVFLSFLPFGAGAVAPALVGLLGGLGVLIGSSIYRTQSPVNMHDALNFFSTCWTCQLFADVMTAMSNMLPNAYSAIGLVTIPMALALTGIWFVWKLVSGFINAKVDNPWDITSTFTTHLVKLTLVCGLLAAPLPRMVTNIVIEPIFNVGLALNRTVSGGEDFDKCVIATAVVETSSNSGAVARGAYSPNLRYNLACELASVHQMTGLGMAAGWTMLSMAFNANYMHQIMWGIPVFPNVSLFFCGLLIVILFFVALLPVPLYFLEIFVKLSMDLIMLPLMLLSWLFKDWAIFPQGGKNIREIINDVVSGTLGIALTGVFVIFAVMFLNAAFGEWGNSSALRTAIEQNDSHILMQGIMMQNNSLVTIVLMGIFITMFMTSIVALAKTLFSVNISQSYYDTAKKDVKIVWDQTKKLWTWMKK